MERAKVTTLVLVLLMTAIFGFHNQGLADSKQKAVASGHKASIKRIVVMPFQNMVLLHGKNRALRGPVTQKAFVTGEAGPESELVMDHVLHGLIKHDSRDIQWDWIEDVEKGPLANTISGAALIENLQRVGRRKKADAVMVGYLYAFREREGGNYGAQTPASVAFELALLQVNSGAVMWRKGFSETQRALNENLLELGKFIRRKGRWVTAREMSKQAMQEMLKTIPWP